MTVNIYKFVLKHNIKPAPSIFHNTVDAEPGFLEEIFEYLKNISPSDSDCNLTDAMAIRKKIIYDSNSDKFMGYCDFGYFHLESQETPASESLVFMLVSLNGK